MLSSSYLGSCYKKLQRASNHTRRYIPLLLAIWLAALSSLSLLPTQLYSQDSSYGNGEKAASIQIETVDTSAFPAVGLTLKTQNLPTLSSDSLLLREGDTEHSVTDLQSEETALQIAIFVDPRLIEQEQSGQTARYTEMAYILYALANQKILRRQEDQVAVFTLQPDGQVRVIQPWSDEPNLAYNSVVEDLQKSSPALEPPSNGWIALLKRFDDVQATQLPNRMALVYTDTERVLSDEFIATAQDMNVTLQLVSLGEASEESSASPALSNAASQTGGRYINYPLEGDAALFQTVEEQRTLYRVTYQSALTQDGQVSVAVSLTDGTSVAASTELSISSSGETASSESSPSLQTQTTSSETLDEKDSVAPVADSAEAAGRSVPNDSTQDEATSSDAETSDSADEGTTGDAETSDATTSDTATGDTATGDATTSDTATGDTATDDTLTEEKVADATGIENVAQGVSESSNNEPSAPEMTGSGSTITIPLINVDVPRSVLQITLPLLLILVAYLLYSDFRERRAARQNSTFPGQAGMGGSPPPANPLPPLNSGALNSGPQGTPQQPAASNQSAAGPPHSAIDHSYAAPRSQPDESGPPVDDLDDLRPLHPPRRRHPLPATPSTPKNDPMPSANEDFRYYGEVDEDGEVTMTPTNRFGDDQATYRLAEDIELPIMGQLIRVTKEPKLPQTLLIYGYRSGYGDDRQIYIGRHTKHNTIVINDKSISREHAVIVQKGGRIYIRDNASTAGTYLNWERLEAGQEKLLRHKDLIGFGEIIYEFQVQGEDEVTAAGE
ncbi:MAG: FHA domain-containing protein [Chloroflexota bacterium]